MPARKKVPLLEWVLSNIVVADNGCWIWQRYVTPNGYGMTSVQWQRGVLIHRVTYAAAYGPIPGGYVCDHICHDPVTCVGGDACPHRRCVNPSHIALTTNSANVARQTRAFRTHCAQGHEWTPENTGRDHGRRRCRECLHQRQRAYATKRAATRRFLSSAA